MHRLLYLRDRRDYGDRQDWTVKINDRDIQCYASRSDVTNAWCGYVEVGDMKISDEINVHGGITGGSDTSIGFDCSHYNDWYPGPDGLPVEINAVMQKPSGHYWTFPDVKAETERMAQQIFG